MTRINMGIMPSELCDQHLLAEWKEAPRVLTLWRSREAKGLRPPGRDVLPTLGRGHVLYFTRYPQWVYERLRRLRAEMVRRGWSPAWLADHCWSPVWLADHGWYEPQVDYTCPSSEHIKRFRPLIQQRIRERLASMRGEPRWTNTTPPAWIYEDATCATQP